MMKEQDAREFFCDYFRVVILGFENQIKLENMMENDIESRKHYIFAISQSLIRIGDALTSAWNSCGCARSETAMASVGSDPSIY